MKHNFSFLAIDMGAGSIRIMQAFFAEEVSLKECCRFENQLFYIDGAERWDLGTITRTLEAGIIRAIDESPMPVISMGVDSWGVDFVMLNARGEVLEDPVSYRDQRTEGMLQHWNSSMSGLETFQRTGINYNIFNTLYQLLSLKGSEVLKQSHRILFMADYINYWLTGVAVNELTLASTSQMLSCKQHDWDDEIFKILGLKRDKLTPLVLPGTRLGKLKPDFETIAAPEVIAVAGHDTACAVAAIPFESNDAAFLSTGTWCIVGMLSDVPLLTDEAYRAGITNERSADGRFRPLMNLMGLWLIQQLRKAFGSRHSYEAIDLMAASSPVSTVLIDPSDELFYHPENMQKAFDSYFQKHNQPGLQSEAAYYRCAYDSLVASFQKSMLLFEKLRGKPFRIIHVIGGGVQSALLCQLIANALGREVLAGPVEGAVYGNLMLQLQAIGKLDETLKEKIYASMTLKKYDPTGS